MCLADGDAIGGTNAGATGSDITSCAPNDTADVWYRYTPATSGNVTISLCFSTLDTTLAVFDACGGGEITCNDDACGRQSELNLDMVGGRTYLIRVAGFNGEMGQFTIGLSGGGGSCGDQPPSPSPTAGPLAVTVNSTTLTMGDPLRIDANVKPLPNIFTAYGIIAGPGVTYSMILGTPSQLLNGIVPLAVNVPGLPSEVSQRLFELSSIPPGVHGTFDITLGLVEYGMPARSTADCIPGYSQTVRIEIP